MSSGHKERFQLSHPWPLKSSLPKPTSKPNQILSQGRTLSATKITAGNWLGLKSLRYVARIQKSKRRKKSATTLKTKSQSTTTPRKMLTRYLAS